MLPTLQGVTPKQYCVLFQTLNNTDIFRESYLQTVIQTFPDFISSNNTENTEIEISDIIKHY